MRLQGKVALITGAASGMGKSEAEIFAREGAKVVLADVLDAEGKAAADGIGANARYVHLDVTSESAWEQVIATTVAQFGKLDVLVNNAGISGTFDADIMSTSAWDKLMDVNAKGVFLGMKTALPVMLKQGAGSIVNISSVSGFVVNCFRLTSIGFNSVLNGIGVVRSSKLTEVFSIVKSSSIQTTRCFRGCLRMRSTV